MPVVAIPRILREKLGDDGVDSLVDLFNKSEQKIKEDVIALSAEKFERRLSEEISGIRSDLVILEGKIETRITKEISQIRQEISQIRQDFTSLEARIEKKITEETSKIRVEMASFKSEIIKWMFLFWIGQLACVAGIVNWLR